MLFVLGHNRVSRAKDLPHFRTDLSGGSGDIPRRILHKAKIAKVIMPKAQVHFSHLSSSSCCSKIDINSSHHPRLFTFFQFNPNSACNAAPNPVQGIILSFRLFSSLSLSYSLRISSNSRRLFYSSLLPSSFLNRRRMFVLAVKSSRFSGARPPFLSRPDRRVSSLST